MCIFNTQDTVEMGAKTHGMSNQEIDNMIKEINTQLSKEFLEKKHNSTK